jgi:hypothetical protein
MPTARALVGGGVVYDNTNVDSKYQPYYYFKATDRYQMYAGRNTGYMYSGSASIMPASTLYDGKPGGNYYCSNLFSGILPYQNPNNQCYLLDNINQYGTSISYYMMFGLPVTITKYRLWNGFAANVIAKLQWAASWPYSRNNDFGNETPQDWALYGTNDGFSWNLIDSRSSQARLPYATANHAKDSSYSEFTISNPTPYKTYKLAVTKGGRTGTSCGKSGCSYAMYQLGEMQLWGYESPDTNCSIHGIDTIFPKAVYPASNGSLSTESVITYQGISSFSKIFTLCPSYIEVRADAKDFYGNAWPGRESHPQSEFVNGSWVSKYCIQSIYYYGYGIPSRISSVWARSHEGWGFNSSLTYVPIGTIWGTGYIDFGASVTISSYKIRGGAEWYNGDISPNSWTLYGSNDFSSWTSISNISSNSSMNYLTYTNFNISSPSSYRYYKMEIKGGKAQQCGKSGCTAYTARIYDMQIVGKIS